MRLPPSHLGAFLLVCIALAAPAQVRITEFMASNTQTLYDEDGETSDWIEIQNTSATNVSLLNWALSDSAGDPTKWLFPATNLASGSFMVVFASGKDRRVPGAPLHTNFKLDAEGEFLSLTAPDGTTATQLSPQYPQQFPDVSYGIEMLISNTTLIASNAAIVYCIPTNSADDATLDAARIRGHELAHGHQRHRLRNGPLRSAGGVLLLEDARHAARGLLAFE